VVVVDPEGVIEEGRFVRVGRACAAVLRDGLFGPEILMVRHRDFWTLPGGGIDPGESEPAAAERELLEETGLTGRARRQLFPGCWEVEVDPSARISIGWDPEHEAAGEPQVLRGVAWFTLDEKWDDRHVSQVIEAIGHVVGSNRRT
jgi:8-oxo-dGTP diphosphatase